jgi:hypothetical protein
LEEQLVDVYNEREMLLQRAGVTSVEELLQLLPAEQTNK